MMKQSIKDSIIAKFELNQNRGFDVLKEMYDIDKDIIQKMSDDDFDFQNKNSLGVICEHVLYAIGELDSVY